jgi:hypothetical protein
MSNDFYFYHQQEAKSPWTLALSSQRAQINRDLKPELNTVLDVNTSMDEAMSLEDKSKVKYRGDMYFDFDCEDTEEVISYFKEFLSILQSKGVNLRSLRIYASGGKGFHIEMPAIILMAKVPLHGIAALPLIYREVAYSLFVNTLDLRVYSQGKGRQWRQPNIKRANGNYKVQITLDEAFEMTVEGYADVISRPRPVFPVEDAVFNSEIALLYAKARDKVDKGLATRRKKKPGTNDLKRFNGQWPETLKTILNGVGLKPDVGWNYIVVQLATAAVDLGKTEDQLIEDAKGILETYQGDSSRYGSAKKRERELRDKHRYFAENPCYDYSIGGILSMVDKETQAATDLTLGEFVADVVVEGEEVDEEDEGDEPTTQVRVNRNGLWSRGEQGWKRISDFGFANATLLRLPQPANKIIGYDIDGYIKGVGKGRITVAMSDLVTKSTLHNLLLRAANASFKGTDMDAAHIVDYLREKVEHKSRVTYVTQVEGIDTILPPDAKNPEEVDIIWSSPTGVITTGTTQYTFKSGVTGEATYNSDLWGAQALGLEDAQMIEDLMTVNTPQNLARILGWYSATFLCPLMRLFYRQFPLLQIYGGASAGKSKTVALMAHIHYHLHTPRITAAAQFTPFALVAAAAASNSIPMYLEECRPRYLTHGKWEGVLNVLKSSYDGQAIARGGLSANKGEGPVVTQTRCTAPIVYVAEEKNSETAVQERSISVCLSAMDRYGRDKQYDRLLADVSHLGRLGKSLALNTLSLDIPKFRSEMNGFIADIKGSMTDEERAGKDRPIFNLAAVLMGLRFMKATVGQVFGTKFDHHFDLMSDAVRDNVIEFVPHNMSESSRVLDTMAQLTKVLDVQFKMEYGREYTVANDGTTVDIKLKPAYAKYMKYQRSLGSVPLYDSDQAFIAAMVRYGGVTSKACVDNDRLFGGPTEPVYRFSVSFMEKEQVESFKP